MFASYPNLDREGVERIGRLSNDYRGLAQVAVAGKSLWDKLKEDGKDPVLKHTRWCIMKRVAI